jgi:hypothetical protein
MVIEIALGIVLAVLILAALPHILPLIAGAGAIAAVAIVLILVVTFVLKDPAILLVIPFGATIFTLLYHYDKSSKVRIFSWGAFTLFSLLSTTVVLYAFHDAPNFSLTEQPLVTIFSILFFSTPAILSSLKFRKILKQEKKGATDGSLSNEGLPK